MIGFDRMFNGSMGMQVNRMLEALGMPENLGDMVGAQIDSSRGDFAGMMRNLQDLTSGMSTSQMDAVFGRGLPGSMFVPRPMDVLRGGFLGASMMAPTYPPMGFNPLGGISREAPFGMGLTGRSIEQACRFNPMFRSQLEQMLGGRIIPDFRNDGRLSVFRPPFNMLGMGLRQSIGAGLLPGMGIAGALGGLGLPMGGPLMGNPVARSILGGLQRMEYNMISMVAGPGSKAALMADPGSRTMANGMGIDIRNASFEDIIFLLLMKYAKNKENDIMKKVNDLNKSEQAANNKGFMGGLGSLAGGAAGLWLGGPMGAMMGSQMGGQLGGALANGGAPYTGQGQDVFGANADPSQMSDTMKQQMLQKLMGDLQKLYEMLTNMIKTMHDMQMSPIRNLRG